MRKYIVCANWKMNGTQLQVKSLVQDLSDSLNDLTSQVTTIVCPPAIFISEVYLGLKNSNILLGAQDCAYKGLSAFTGEISASMLSEFGCKYVIIGHSERRALLGEACVVLAGKLTQAKESGLIPIFCVGETKVDFDAGLGYTVVERQLQEIVQLLGVGIFDNAIIAYEPVWAIGTGLTATPEQAQRMHQSIRKILAEFDDGASNAQIIYGGSVNANNCAALFEQPDIDGALVGGASLKAQEFSKICHTALKMAK